MTGKMPSDSILPEVGTHLLWSRTPLGRVLPGLGEELQLAPGPAVYGAEVRAGRRRTHVGCNLGPGSEPGIGCGSVHSSGNRQFVAVKPKGDQSAPWVGRCWVALTAVVEGVSLEPRRRAGLVCAR